MRKYKVYSYKNGYWSHRSGLSISFANLIAALEGLFLHIATAKPKWGWMQVRDTVAKCLENEGAVAELQMLAKTASGHTRIGASNQLYRANWAGRLADSLRAFALDNDKNSFVGDMAKYHLKNCDTEKHISCGYCFDDVYLDYNFEESPTEGWKLLPAAPVSFPRKRD